MSGAFEAKSGKLKSGFSSGKSGDIYIITSEGKVVLLVHPNSTNPLEDIRRNIKAVHQDEFDKKIKALESKPSGGGGGGLTEEQVLALIKRALKGRTGLFPIATPPNVFRPGMIIKGSDINGSQWSFPVQYLNRGITGSSSVPCPMTPEQMNAIWRVIGTAMWSSGDYGTHTTLVQEVIDG